MKINSILFLLAMMALGFHAQATVHIVLADNFFYAPAALTIDDGDTVRFQWVAGSHPTSSTTGDWVGFVSFPLNSSSTQFDLVLPGPGTYDYQCDFHVGLGMVGTITVNAGCVADSAPTNLMAVNNASNATLSWDPINGSVACQVKGTRIVPPGPSPSVNIFGAEPTSTNVPYSAAGSGTTWEFRVRCACSVSPLVVTPFSTAGTFSVPAPKLNGVNSGLTLFPNPNDGQLFAGFDSKGGKVVFSILDISGKLISSKTGVYGEGSHNEFFDLTDQKAGIYFLQIEEGDYRASSEFTIIY